MSDALGLTPTEAAVAASVLRGLTHPTNRLTLFEFVCRWDQFSRDVENGYGLTTYDYENSLSGRSVLWRVTERLPQAIADRLSAALRPGDDRFEAATLPFPLGVVPTRGRDEWWFFRKPKRLTGELASEWQT